MKVNEFDKQYQVYYSALDRIVKKINDSIYETYHITVLENKKVMTINTVDLGDLSEEEINDRLAKCGLVYIEKDKKIVQLHDLSQVIEEKKDILPYVLADRLHISGYINDVVEYNFEKASELNEIMLEHDIPIKFSRSLLETL